MQKPIQSAPVNLHHSGYQANANRSLRNISSTHLPLEFAIIIALILIIYCLFSIYQGKRKASMDNLMLQPPVKKMATLGPMGVMPVNSMPVNMQGPSGGFSTPVEGPRVSLSMLRHLQNEKMLRREVGSSRALKTSTVLAQAWREDAEGGHLLASLFELFGESMFSFTHKSELYFFL